MADYSVTGNPISLSRGASALIRVEFGLIATAIATKSDVGGDTYTGTHAFAGATSVTVPTPTTATQAATKAYCDALAMSAALPSQSLGFVISDGATASFSQTFTGFAANEVKGADIASAATINLTTATGNLVHVTGTTTITAITIPSGAERTVVFDGALTLTHHSTTLILPSGANITTAAGDSMKVRGDGSGNARVVSYTKASGLPVVSATPGLVLLATLTPTAAANVDFLNTFTSSYDNYLILVEGVNSSAASDDALRMRFAVAGTVDTGSKYFSPDFSGTPAAASTSLFLISQVISAGLGCGGSILIQNANSTTKLKTGSSVLNTNNSAAPEVKSGATGIGYNATNAISGFRLYWSAGSNFTAVGTVRVYGYSNT